MTTTIYYKVNPEYAKEFEDVAPVIDPQELELVHKIVFEP